MVCPIWALPLSLCDSRLVRGKRVARPRQRSSEYRQGAAHSPRPTCYSPAPQAARRPRLMRDILGERGRLLAGEVDFLRFARSSTGAAGGDGSRTMCCDSGRSPGSKGWDAGASPFLATPPRPKASRNIASYQSMTASAVLIQGSAARIETSSSWNDPRCSDLMIGHSSLSGSGPSVRTLTCAAMTLVSERVAHSAGAGRMPSMLQELTGVLDRSGAEPRGRLMRVGVLWWSRPTTAGFGSRWLRSSWTAPGTRACESDASCRRRTAVKQVTCRKPSPIEAEEAGELLATAVGRSFHRRSPRSS